MQNGEKRPEKRIHKPLSPALHARRARIDGRVRHAPPRGIVPAREIICFVSAMCNVSYKAIRLVSTTGRGREGSEFPSPMREKVKACPCAGRKPGGREPFTLARPEALEGLNRQLPRDFRFLSFVRNDMGEVLRMTGVPPGYRLRTSSQPDAYGSRPMSGCVSTPCLANTASISSSVS